MESGTRVEGLAIGKKRGPSAIVLAGRWGTRSEQSTEQGLPGTLLSLRRTTVGGRGDKGVLGSRNPGVVRGQSLSSWRLPLDTPYHGHFPLILKSSRHLHFIPFRATPSLKGQQMAPVSCWSRPESACQPPTLSWLFRTWGMLRV